MKYNKISRPTEDILCTTFSFPAAGTSFVIPFPNEFYTKTHSLVQEIIRIRISNTTGTSAIQYTISRGQTAPLTKNEANVLANYTQLNNFTDELNFHDGCGNGYLVPEDYLYLQTTTAGAGQFVQIYYKKRIVSNEELWVYYYNYNKA